MLFSYVPFGVTVMVLGCPDYLHKGVYYTPPWILKDSSRTPQTPQDSLGPDQLHVFTTCYLPKSNLSLLIT